jgi:hypothetical protein
MQIRSIFHFSVDPDPSFQFDSDLFVSTTFFERHLVRLLTESLMMIKIIYIFVFLQAGTKPYEIVQATKVRKGLKPGNPDLASYLDKL